MRAERADDKLSRDLQPRSARPSIYSVAELAGVSHMTGSRVLNGGPLKEATRSKVLAAIEDHCGIIVTQVIQARITQVLHGGSCPPAAHIRHGSSANGTDRNRILSGSNPPNSAAQQPERIETD